MPGSASSSSPASSAASPAEISSIASLLDQVTARVTAMAESAAAAHEGEIARELFGVERSLVTAQRRMDKLAWVQR